MLGASAIDLAWTAEGRLDVCILLGNNPWDTSAGVLIAREAGARVLDDDGFEALATVSLHDRGHAIAGSGPHGGNTSGNS